ncbi:MAG: N-acetylmuramoyl-L-alanine amidase, partial [Ruminiclostridium sp.]|nr:N-acetylmuramoyl-L-alanine amidase [Ruminiclostridium sp.]
TVVKEQAVSDSVKKISYYTGGGKEFIFLNTSAKKIEKQFILKPMEGNPYYRLCVQFSDAYIGMPGNLDVYAGSLQQIRYAQADNTQNIASIVVEIDHNPSYTVTAVSNGIQIAITSNKSSANTSTQTTEPEPTKAPTPAPTSTPTPTPTPTQVKQDITPTPVPTQATPKPTPTTIPDQPEATPTPVPVASPTPTPTVTPESNMTVGTGAIRYIMDGDSCVVLLDGVDLSEKAKENPDLYKIEYRSIEKMLQIRMPLNQDYKTEVIPGNNLLHGIISFKSNARNEVNIRISGKSELNYVIASNGTSGSKIVFNPDGNFAYNPTPAPEQPNITPTPVPSQTTPKPTPTVAPAEPKVTPTPTAAPAQPKVTPTPTAVPAQPKVTPTPTAAPAEPKITPTPTAVPDQPKVTPTPMPTNTPSQPTPTPTPLPASGSLANRGEGDRSGTVSFVAGTEKIIMDTIALDDYKIFRLSNPSRIVIDLPENLIDANEYNYSNRIYSKIRTGQFQTTTARMVIEVNENTEWEAKKNGNSLNVSFNNSGIKNLLYTSVASNAALKITKPGIRQLIQENIDRIETEDDKKSGTFSFIFPKGIIDLGSGKMQTGEKIMKNVHTLTTDSKTYLVLSRENSDAKYQISFTDSDDEILVNLSDGTDNGQPVITPTPKPSEGEQVNNGKLVVLDPGHGGSESGATYGKGEKWYNLDIALKTAAILKSRGVNVKLTREKDEFVGLYERAEMANNWKADVFVSIHNNAFFDKKVNGSMTFFYTGSYKGKEYATIIQNDILRNLCSKDIGVKAQNFVVIRETKMPAVLVEVGCLSNDAEREKLDTEEYRMKTAQSLAESIIKIISN